MSTTTTTITAPVVETVLRSGPQTKQYPKPLSPSGALDKFQQEDLTPVIGREFINVNLVDDIINAKNSDELIRDLAITSKYQRPIISCSAC